MLSADRYRLETTYGDSYLFAKDRELLAFLAGEGDESLLAYRADYFPDGLELAEASSWTMSGS